MSQAVKKVIAIVASVLIIFAIYMSAYLPFMKAHASKTFGISQSEMHLLDPTELFGPKLDFYSPIGHDRVISAYFKFLNNFLDQVEVEEYIADSLFKQLENAMKPYLDARKGINFHKNLLKFALLYKKAAVTLNNLAYLERSVELLRESMEVSPWRPVVFYTLFDIYHKTGNVENAKLIGEDIIERWDDEKIKEILEQLPVNS